MNIIGILKGANLHIHADFQNEELEKELFANVVKYISVQAFDALLTCGVRDFTGLLRLSQEDLHRAGFAPPITTELTKIQRQLIKNSTKCNRPKNEIEKDGTSYKAILGSEQEACEDVCRYTLDLEPGSPIPDELKERLPTRARNVLIRERILTIECLLEYQEKDLCKIAGIGRKTVSDLKKLQDKLTNKASPIIRTSSKSNLQKKHHPHHDRPNSLPRVRCYPKNGEHWPSDPPEWSLLSRTLPDLFWVTLPSANAGYEENVRIGDLGIASAAKHNPELRERLSKLLLQRARIISSAQQKLPSLLRLLRGMLDENRQSGDEPNGILIYCAPGGHKEVLQEVAALGLRCHEFVHDVSLSDREKLLCQFDAGDIQVLVAIKCLDEGVDVPSTRTAFILASSTNPREFVQRRGRILRKSEGKRRAVIYDFIVAPPLERLTQKNSADVAILKREMPRFVEFASSALNEFEARSVVRNILDYLEMLNLLEEKPWDVYHTLKQWDWSEP